MVNIIHKGLVEDMVVSMASQVVLMVVPQTSLMEVIWIVPFLSLGDDVDMINVLNSINNLNKV